MKKIVLCLAVIALITKSSVHAVGAGADDNGGQIVLHSGGGAIRGALESIDDGDKLKVKILAKLGRLESKSPVERTEYERKIMYLGFQLHKYREGQFDVTQLGIPQKDLDKVRRKHVLELVAQETAHPGSVEEFRGLPPHTLTMALQAHTDLPDETIAFLQDRVNAVFVAKLDTAVGIASDTRMVKILETAANAFHKLPAGLQRLIRDKAGITSGASAAAGAPRPKKEGAEAWLTGRKAITFAGGVAASAATGAGFMAVKTWLGL